MDKHTPDWLHKPQCKLIKFYAFGRSQPTVQIMLKPAIDADTLQQKMNQSVILFESIEKATGHTILDTAAETRNLSWESWVRYMGECTHALITAANQVASDPVKITRLPQHDRVVSDRTTMHLSAPPGQPDITITAWKLCLRLLSQCVHPDPAHLLKRTQEAIERLLISGPPGSNTPRFLQAAYELKIPVTSLGMNIYQYGHGANACWLDSSFTQNTSTIATKMARNKQSASTRLQQAGLPVAKQVLVTDSDSAIKAAMRLGYPVVVKPLSLDGGKGVIAGIDNREELLAAYTDTRQHSKKILIEEHVNGKDYRMHVFQGELIWAIERTPAGITGDGVHTIQQLVDTENSNPLRGESQHAPLKYLKLDMEAQRLLGKLGLTTTSIPEEGRFIQLRRIANVSSGGTPKPIFDQVHPDNAALAVRAAEALRLDFAGIDLLIPDISKSWKEVRAAICEVNSQPQIGTIGGPHLYREILQRSIKGDGRIPIIAVLGEKPNDGLTEAIAQQLSNNGLCVGRSDANSVRIDEQSLTKGPLNSWYAAEILATNQHVEAIVLSINDMALLNIGSPFERIDWLVLAGKYFKNKGVPVEMTDQLFKSVLSTILPACTQHFVMMSDAGFDVEELLWLFKTQLQKQPYDRDGLLEAISAQVPATCETD